MKKSEHDGENWWERTPWLKNMVKPQSINAERIFCLGVQCMQFKPVKPLLTEADCSLEGKVGYSKKESSYGSSKQKPGIS